MTMSDENAKLFMQKRFILDIRIQIHKIIAFISTSISLLFILIRLCNTFDVLRNSYTYTLKISAFILNIHGKNPHIMIMICAF